MQQDQRIVEADLEQANNLSLRGLCWCVLLDVPYDRHVIAADTV